MNMTNEDKALLETDFPAEIEKEAAEQAAVLGELYEVGFTKMAAAAADAMDNEEKESKEEEAKEEEKKKVLTEEHKKEAAARGAFLARYYIDGLKKEGSERHGDEFHYLYPSMEAALVKAGADAKAAKGIWEAIRGYHKGIAEHARKAVTGKAISGGKAKELEEKARGKGLFNLAQKLHKGEMKGPLSTKQRLAEGGKAALKSLPHLAGGALAAGGAYKALKKD